jgi:RNA 3'-terminal phosphate cyclase (ATP)
MLGRLGINVRSSIERYGFYPKGGGKISVTVRPCGKINGISLEERGDVLSVSGVSAVGGLPLSIAERQKMSAEAALAEIPVQPVIMTMKEDTYSPGTFLFLKVESEACISGFSSLGERGKRAETVGEEAAQDLLRHYKTGACIDPHLADQLAVYLCLAGNPSQLTTSRISGHLETNLKVIQIFLGTRFQIEGEREKCGRVEIIP